jgi:hypothetical protein
MPVYSAENVEITVKDGFWKAFNTTGRHTLQAFFVAVRGNRVVNYSAEFGELRGLPGDVLGADYIHAVVVGYDDARRRWLLGLQVALKSEEKLRFVGLAQWPEGDNPQYGADGQAAGRALAEYIGCQLKLFGIKKVPTTFNKKVSVTGPLEEHRREDIDAVSVQLRAGRIQLPLTAGELSLSRTKNTLALRNPKEAVGAKAGDEAPAYVQGTIDIDAKVIKLLPPTGLLGSFFGPSGKVIKFDQVRNVELRHVLSYEPSTEKDADGGMIDFSRRRHQYAIFLTLKDEIVLLVKLEHIIDPRRTTTTMRAVQVGVTSGPREIEQEMSRLREFEREAGSLDQKGELAENMSLIIAAAISCPLVKTTVGGLEE